MVSLSRWSPISRGWLAGLALLASPASTALRAADDAASLLRGDPEYVRRVELRDFNREYAPYPVYFPPTPPPLGAAIDRIKPLYDLKWLTPPEMGEYVSEPFYPRLAQAIASDTLDNTTARRIEAYRDERVGLRKALQEKIASLRDAPLEERRKGLQALAREQADALALSERTAEQLRSDLASPMILRNERERKTNRKRANGRSEVGRAWEFEIVRNAAYLLDGLSPAQRRLLREAVTDLDDRPDIGPPRPGQPEAEAWLPISPEAGVVILPPDLPKDLAAQAAAYRHDKALVKRQLRDLLYVLDEAQSEIDAIRDVRSSAQKQAPLIAELEQSADTLREALGTWMRTRRTAIPPDIERALAGYLTERRLIDMEIVSRVNNAKKPLLAFAGQRNPDSLPRGATIPQMDNGKVPARDEFEGLTGNSLDNRTRALYKVTHTAIEEARQQLAPRIAANEAVRTEIVEGLARTIGSGKASGEARVLATADFERHVEEYRLRTEYADYFDALFEPGLSPEQRRLLFDGAIEKLAPPLPGGSFKPWPVVR